MKVVNAVALLVIAACAVVAVFVVRSPEPPPPRHAPTPSGSDAAQMLGSGSATAWGQRPAGL